jgi:hypothetical protein
MVSPGIIDRSRFDEQSDPKNLHHGDCTVQPEEVVEAVMDFIRDGSINGVNRDVGRDIFR